MSYVGALILRLAVVNGMKVLVLSYTNHALDQFLLDLGKFGIHRSHITRIGAKPSKEAEHLNVEIQQKNQRNRDKSTTTSWTAADAIAKENDKLAEELGAAFRKLQDSVKPATMSNQQSRATTVVVAGARHSASTSTSMETHSEHARPASETAAIYDSSCARQGEKRSRYLTRRHPYVA